MDLGMASRDGSTVTDLSDWLRNGEMAQHNADLLEERPSRGPGKTAVLMEDVGKRPKRRHKWQGSEYTLQEALFKWKYDNLDSVPELEMMYAVPNGQYRSGQRPEPGIEKGVLDINLDYAAGGYHGLRIELKVKYNKPSPDQLEWIERYERRGYKTAVCYDLAEAQQIIIDYTAAGGIRP